jgi:uncharacterized protein involved in outer membrane biogenesis
MAKRWWIIPGAAVLLGIAAISVPFLMNVNSYREAIQTQLSKALNRDVALNELHLTMFPLAIESKDVQISDDPAFRRGDFIRIGDFRLRLNLWLLLHREIQVTSVEMIGPSVWLVKNSLGVWNFSTMKKTAAPDPSPVPATAGTAPSTAPTAAAIHSMDVSELSITNGHLVILDQAHPQEMRSYDLLDFNVHNLSLNHASPFSMTVSVSEWKEPVHVEGEAGPLDLGDIENSPAHGDVDAKLLRYGDVSLGEVKGHFQYAQQAFEVDLAAKVLRAGSAELETLQAHFKFFQEALKGDAEAKMFRFGTTELQNVRGQFTLAKQILKVDSLDFDLYSGHHTGELTMVFRGPRPSIDLNSRISSVDTHQYLAQTTSAHDTLYGLLNGNLAVRDPGEKSVPGLGGLVGRASLDLQKGRLANLSIGNQIVEVAKLAGINFPEGDTTIQKLSGNFDIADNWARTNDLQLEVPDLSLLCQGGFSFDNELKFDVMATFSKEASQKMHSGTVLGGVLGTLLENQHQQFVIPLQVTGTFKNPHFKLDSQKLLATQTKGNASPANLQQTIRTFQGLFKKKK